MGSSASVSLLQPLPFDPHSFPKLGVKLSFLNDFILLECGGRENLQNLTTTEVCERFIKPITQTTQSSYCDLLQHLNHPSVGEANVFISHAWKFQFLDVVDSLSYHFRDRLNSNNSNEDEVIIWIDIFSNNQHKAVDLDFNYWATTFMLAIQKFSHTVMILSPWNDPIPLTRAWCLWELYCTVNTHSKFDIAMTKESYKQFVRDILNDADGEINKMLATIDVERSQCFYQSDQERIFDVIKKDVGFSQLNSLVFERLRNWVIETFENKLKDPDVSRDPRYLNATATLYANQGIYDKAEIFYEKCLKLSIEVLGDSHPDLLNTMNNLALLYHNQGKYNQSQVLFEECYRLKRELLGDKHPDTLTTMNGLAVLYYHQRKFYESEQLYTQCLSLRRNILGNNHPNTLTSMNNLAVLYKTEGRYRESEELYVECYQLNREILGPNHPHTLNIMNNLAALYKVQGKYEESKCLYEECYRLSKEILGEKHPNTFTIMNALNKLYLLKNFH